MLQLPQEPQPCGSTVLEGPLRLEPSPDEHPLDPLLGPLCTEIGRFWLPFRPVPADAAEPRTLVAGSYPGGHAESSQTE